MRELLLSRMNTTARFFALLRSGLWGTPVEDILFSDGETDWGAIVQLASEQAVLGIVFDGMEKLPSTQRPSGAIFMKWLSAVVRIEQSHELLNRELANIVTLYSENGISSLLLKGQGVATLYLRPEHRQCGDIDLYLGDDYDKAKKLIASLNIPFHPESDKHISFKWNGVEIENHCKIARFYCPDNDKRLNRFIDSWAGSSTKDFIVHDVKVALPAPGFNAVYLLVHAFVHFIQEGIGLRQVCDWTRLFAVHSNEIDRERFIREISYLRLEDVACAFGYVVVNYLGLSADLFPFSLDGEKNKTNGEFLINDTLQGGNFGIHHEVIKNKPEQQSWKRKYYTYSAILARSKELRRFSPSEARWYPFWRMRHLIDKMMHGRLWQ